mmetsp:Transcript_58428/g.136559  ORF Transcript_58428/g.136559 Transcript_58428/m.136559 type:complete len:343 (-) Transcript_58428:710-1738(-)
MLQKERRAAALQATLCHDCNSIAQDVCLIHEVRGEYCHTTLSYVANHVPSGASAEGIHARGRLVKEAHTRLAYDSQAKGQLSPLPTRKRGCASVYLLSEPHLLHHLLHAPWHIIAVHTSEEAIYAEMLTHSEVLPQDIVLWADSNDSSNAGHPCPYGKTSNVGVPTCRGHHAGEHIDGCGLPSTIVAKQCQNLSRVHRQVQVGHSNLGPSRGAEHPAESMQTHKAAAGLRTCPYSSWNGFHGLAVLVVGDCSVICTTCPRLMHQPGVTAPIGWHAEKVWRQSHAKLLRPHTIQIPTHYRPKKGVKKEHQQHHSEVAIVHRQEKVRPCNAHVRSFKLGDHAQT